MTNSDKSHRSTYWLLWCGPSKGFAAAIFSGMVAIKRNQNNLLQADVLEDNVWPSNLLPEKRYA